MATHAPGLGKIPFPDLLLFIICRSTLADMTVKDMVDNGLVAQESAAALNQLGTLDATFTPVQNLWAEDAEYGNPPCPDIPELQAIRNVFKSSKHLVAATKK